MSAFQPERSFARTLALPQWSRMNARVGAGVDQLHRVAELRGPHAQVEAQAHRCRARRMPRDEALVEAIARGRLGGVEHLAQALDRGPVLVAGEVGREAVRRGPARDHRADHRRAAPADQVEHVIRLGRLLRRLDVHLHVDGFDDVEARRRPRVVVHQEGPIQLRGPCEPGELEAGEVPEVLVRIDDRHRRRLVRPGRGREPGGDRQGGGPSEEVAAVHRGVHRVGAPVRSGPEPGSSIPRRRGPERSSCKLTRHAHGGEGRAETGGAVMGLLTPRERGRRRARRPTPRGPPAAPAGPAAAAARPLVLIRRPAENRYVSPTSLPRRMRLAKHAILSALVDPSGEWSL